MSSGLFEHFFVRPLAARLALVGSVALRHRVAPALL